MNEIRQDTSFCPNLMVDLISFVGFMGATLPSTVGICQTHWSTLPAAFQVQ